MRRNLIAVVIINSACSFASYFLAYYTKYFPGSFFVNYTMIGIADCFTALFAQLLTKIFKKVTWVVSFILA